MRCRLWVAVCLLGVSAPTLAADLQYTSSEDLQALLLAQQRVIETALNHRGVVRMSPALQSIGAELIARLTGADSGARMPRIRILDTEAVNAISLTNGDIYLNAALLARLERPEELAFVLLHEWAHHQRGDHQRKLMLSLGSDAWQRMELDADFQAIAWMQRNGWSTVSIAALLTRLYQSDSDRIVPLDLRLEALSESVRRDAWQPMDDRLDSARVDALESLLARGNSAGLSDTDIMALSSDVPVVFQDRIRQTIACTQSFRMVRQSEDASVSERRVRWSQQSGRLEDLIPATEQQRLGRHGTPALPVNYRHRDRLVWSRHGPLLDATVIEPLHPPADRCLPDDWLSAASQAMRQDHPDHHLTDLAVRLHPGWVEMSASLIDSRGLRWQIRERLVLAGEDWFRLRVTNLAVIEASEPVRELSDLHERMRQTLAP